MKFEAIKIGNSYIDVIILKTNQITNDGAIKQAIRLLKSEMD